MRSYTFCLLMCREEVLGRNCRFLQGPNTDPQELQKLRDALSAHPPQPVTVILLNYTKQRKPFHNALHIAPVRDADGRVEYFIGIQLDVSEAGDDGQQHGETVVQGFRILLCCGVTLLLPLKQSVLVQGSNLMTNLSMFST
eukprot:GHUV01036901.1.p1 GENE.GHUV01036901.1~~GHUV01036901.1.p1  ORF type:complete len:141 (-),score=15.40 GHUV01036901.1:390-812(-)